MSAYSCQPNRGSEPGVGWNFALQAARFFKVYVLTRESNQIIIEAYLKDHPIENLHFIYASEPGFFDPTGKIKIIGAQLKYYAWQIGSYKVARRAHRKIGFDLAHHVTFVTWRVPSFLWKLNIPFIWGPVGGGGCWCPGLLKIFAISSITEHIRNIHQKIALFDPLVRKTARKSNLAVGVDKDTCVCLRKLGCKNILHFTAANIAPGRLSKRKKKINENNSVKILLVATLLPHKGIDLALESLANISRKKDTVLEIYGSGTDEKKLKTLAQRLGLEKFVIFHGSIDRGILIEKYQEFDLFLLPSLRDSGGMAILEAMEAGLPVICVDSGGPGEFVNNACGIKIKPISREQVISDLTKAIDKLIALPDLRKSMGEEGRKRVLENYTWEKKGLELKKIYEELLDA